MTTALLVMSDTGGGHRAVCQALAEALQAHTPAIEAPIVDLFALGKRRTLADRLVFSYGPVIRHAPWLYGAAYYLSNHPPMVRLLSWVENGLLVRRGRWLLRRYQPAVITCVHALVVRPMLRAVRAEGLETPVVVVIPDLVRFHRSWVAPGVRVYTAPSAEGATLLRQYGVPAERIVETGIPVGRAFATSVERSTLRARLGLDPQRFTILLMSGGEGSGQLPALVNLIDQAGLPVQLVVVTGRNARARAQIEALPLFTPTRVFGFVTNMPDLIQASDLVITKGGPQSIVECLAAGKPMLITQVLPGQEQGNDRFVARQGAGYITRTPAHVAQAVRRLVQEPEELARLTAAARRLGRPDAAERAAAVILGAIAG